jgi:hypothetical protein
MKRLAAQAQEGDPMDGYVYAKDATDEESGLYVPNSMAAAGEVFEQTDENDVPFYYNYGPVFKVEEGQVVRIGLKKEVNEANYWTLWDSWHLYYFGAASSQEASGNPLGIEDLNNATSLKVEFFTIDGRKATRAQKGIMIQKTTFANGATMVQKIRK